MPVHHIGFTGANKAMTILEIRNAMDSLIDAAADPNSIPKVRINFGGTIKKIECEFTPMSGTSTEN